MQLEALQYLLAIEENGSTRKAAEQLNTSFQNVSRVLLPMEDEWNVQLFQRNSKGMIATEEGKIAIAAAQGDDQRYDQMQQQFKHLAERNVNEQNKRISGTLNVVSSIIVNNAFFNDVLLEFSIEYPKIAVNLVEDDAYLTKYEDTTHIYLMPRTAEELAQSGPNVISLLEDKMVVLIKKDSVLDNQRSISLKRMAELPLALMGKKHWQESVFGHIMKENGVTPTRVTFTSSITGYQKYIGSGQYAALATEIISLKMMSDKRQKLKIIPIRDKNTTIHYCMIVPNVKTLTSVEECFIHFIRDFFHI